MRGRASPQRHEIVGVHHLAPLLGGQVAAALADHRGQLGGVEADHPTRDDGAVRPDEIHDVPGHELAR